MCLQVTLTSPAFRPTGNVVDTPEMMTLLTMAVLSGSRGLRQLEIESFYAGMPMLFQIKGDVDPPCPLICWTLGNLVSGGNMKGVLGP